MGKNYFYNLFISLVNILFPIVTFRYAAHLLGPEGIGKVQFAITFAEYFALFAALGIPLYGIAATARANQGKEALSHLFSELITLHALSGILFSALYFVVIFTLPFFAANLSLFSIAGLIILLGFTSIDWFYFGIEKFKLVALRSISIKLIAVVLLFTFVRNEADLINYLWILLFTILGNNMLSLFFVGRHTKIIFKGVAIKKHLKPVFFILGSNIAINMYALWDTLILGFLTNERNVGLYFAAIKLVKFGIPIIIAFGASLIPRITQAIHQQETEDRDQLLAKSFHYLAFMGFPITMGIYLLAPEFIELLSGPEFEPAIAAMRLLSILPLLIGFGHFLLQQIMLPAGLNKQIFIATFTAALFSIILNFLLIPSLHIIGSGIANIVAELSVTILFYYFVSRSFHLNINWKLLPKSIGCTLLFIPLVYFIRGVIHETWLVLILSIAFCAMIYVALQLFIFKDTLVRGALNKLGLSK